MRDFNTLDKYRTKSGLQREKWGQFLVTAGQRDFYVIGGDEGNFEHISVTPKHKGTGIPKWEEMSKIKDIFWEDEEEVIQFHPKKSEYVNIHEECLHLWRPKKFDFGSMFDLEYGLLEAFLRQEAKFRLKEIFEVEEPKINDRCVNEIATELCKRGEFLFNYDFMDEVVGKIAGKYHLIK